MLGKAFIESLLVSYGRRFPLNKGKVRVVDSVWAKVCDMQSFQRTCRYRYGGYELECDLRDLIQRQVYFFGDYLHERALLEMWCRCSRSARTILDVGANIGVYSLAATWASPAAAVHAFEPAPDIASSLEATLLLNVIDGVRVHRMAVSDRQGTARLIRCDRSESNNGRNLLADAESGDLGDPVLTTTLDIFCADHRISKIDLLKLDVEGHEHRVLEGAQELLTKKRIKYIFLELNWSRPDGLNCPATRCLSVLDDADYVFTDPRRRIRFRPAGPWITHLSDIVAAPAGEAQYDF